MHGYFPRASKPDGTNRFSRLTFMLAMAETDTMTGQGLQFYETVDSSNAYVEEPAHCRADSFAVQPRTGRSSPQDGVATQPR